MKYCMCSTWAKQHPVEHVLNIAKNLKLDGVELWDGHIDGFLSAGHTLDDLNQVLQSHGLECVVIAPYLNFIDPAMAEDTAATARKCMTYAAALHCGMVRIFLGDRSSYEIKKEQWEHCCGLLRQLAKEAEAMDLKLVLEIHNDQPTDTKEAVLKVLRLINSPALGLIFDGFNFYPSGLEMMDAYEPLKKYTVHYHFKNLLWKPPSVCSSGRGRCRLRSLDPRTEEGWI